MISSIFMIVLATPVLGFMNVRTCPARVTTAPMMATVTAVKPIVTIEAPDFYWQFRLERLISKKGGELAFNAKNYPDVSGPRALYDAYYLDLTLQSKMEKFDWASEKEINDSEWQIIYKNICQWTQTTVRANKPDTSNLPANDFDLLAQYYPQVNYRELEATLSVEEVGANFPYKNMKELLGAALAGTLKVPGYSSVTSLDATEIRAELASFKEKTLAKIDTVYADALAFAKNPLPDNEAKVHYQELRTQLATFPQTPSQWSDYRANFEKEVDEMARLAGKKEEEHHHHEEGADDHLSPAKEFELKYGRNLDEMQDRFNKYKADPEAFLEASIIEKFGQSGLNIWKKSLEFSSNLAAMSEADKAKVEKEFADFLTKA